MNRLKDGYVYEIIPICADLGIVTFSQGKCVKVLSHKGQNVMISDCTDGKSYKVSEMALSMVCEEIGKWDN